MRQLAITIAGVLALAVAGVMLTMFAAGDASARSTGIMGYTGNPSTGGVTCATCHGVGEAPPIVDVIGPTEIVAGETATYTVEVFAFEAPVAGFAASVSGFAGTLAATGADVRMLGEEVTHSAPKAGGELGVISFEFEWTAPLVSTQVDIFAAGVAANGNGQNGDDATDNTAISIRVTDGIPEAVATLRCADGAGAVDVAITSPFDMLTDYTVAVGDLPPTVIQASFAAPAAETIAGVPEGPQLITVTRDDGALAFSQTRTVDCSGAAVPIPGADGPIEVAHVSTCLAGNGRIDTNIINTTSTSATYRIEFPGLTPRAFTVAPGDWWRMPITGRPDDIYDVVVKRNGLEISNQAVAVSCDSAPPVVDEPEIQIVNACRAGNGYVLFQFSNNTAAMKSWVIEFQGVPNRSTSTTGFGQSVRAVTGRPGGSYFVTIRSGAVVVDTFQVSVDCG